jgi:O-antigen/teichoic acid export membrane protein
LVRPRLAQEMRSSIYEFSGWFTVSQLVAGCAAQADRYVLGAVRNTAAIGYLNLAQRIEEAAYSVMVKAADSLFPYFSAQSGHGRVNARFYFTVSWLVNLTAAAAIAPLIPLAPSLISLWVNAETASYSSLVLRTLAVAGILGCASHVFKQYLLGTAKARQFAYLNLASAFTASVAAIILLPRYGLRAAGVGALIAMAVQLGIVVALIWRYFRPVGTIRRILSAIFVPLTVAIGGACGIARYDFPTLSTWPKLVGGYLLISASMTLAIFALNSLLAEGRQLLGDLRGSLKLVRAELARRRTVTTVHESDVVRREQGPMQGVDISPPV